MWQLGPHIQYCQTHCLDPFPKGFVLIANALRYVWSDCGKVAGPVTHSYALASSQSLVGGKKSLVQIVCTCLYNHRGIGI